MAIRSRICRYAAPHWLKIQYPRNSGTPIEYFVVIAEYFPGEGARGHRQFPGAVRDASGNGHGSRRAGEPAAPETPPDSGGSFGAKHAVFPYIVLMALAARKAGRPVKWVETRSST